MTGRATCFAAALGTLWLSHARAAPGDATRLEYARSERAAGCPDREALKSAVTKRLGYDPFFPAARQTIVVEIMDAKDGLRAQMHLVNERGMIVGSRELSERAEQCDELVASLALAISIALDPSAALDVQPEPTPDPPSGSGDAQNEPQKPETEPVRDATPAPTVAPSSAIKKKKSESRPSDGGKRGRGIPSTVRAQGFSALGVAPSLAVGFRLGGSLRWGWFQLVAEFADQLPASSEASGGGSATASLYQGTLAPCIAGSWLAGCALLNIGALQSEGRDIPNPAKKSSAYAALGARLEASPQLVSRLRLLVDLDALKSLTPVTLRLRGEDVWKTPFVSLSLGVGLALQFQ